MTTWLHFIGKEYYPTKAKFVREALRYGVTRRVSLTVLKKMRFGDRVLLARTEGKSPVIFGYFIIDRISGLSPEAITAVKKKFRCEVVSSGGGRVERGCGSYHEGITLAVEAGIEDIASCLEELVEAGSDIGKPMIGGKFYAHRLVRLKSIPFRQGFRAFDYSRLLKDIRTAEQGDKPAAVIGQYYVNGQQNDNEGVEGWAEKGVVQEVKEYQRKGEMKYAQS